MNRKIAHITSVHPRFDTRIFLKEVCSIHDAGMDIILIVADGKGDKISNGIPIFDIGKPLNRVTRLLFFWLKISIEVLRRKVKIVHFHDPELIIAAIFLKFFGVRIIMDIHELVSHDIEDKDWLNNYKLAKIAKYFYQSFEILAIRVSSKVILAESGYESYFYNKYKKYRSKFHTIRNVPKMKLIDSKKSIEIQNSNKIIVYVGLISKIRGIFEMLDALKYLDSSYELWLIGRWDSEELQKKCKLHASWEKVKYHGFLPPDEIYGICKAGDIGLSTLHPVENHLYTTPVKSFEYMACKLPMLMSDFPYWVDYYNGKAFFVNPMKPEEIANKIEYVLQKCNQIKEVIKRAYVFAEENSWEREQEILLNIYKEI